VTQNAPITKISSLNLNFFLIKGQNLKKNIHEIVFPILDFGFSEIYLKTYETRPKNVFFQISENNRY
jgi:hypothetical protein